MGCPGHLYDSAFSMLFPEPYMSFNTCPLMESELGPKPTVISQHNKPTNELADAYEWSIFLVKIVDDEMTPSTKRYLHEFQTTQTPNPWARKLREGMHRGEAVGHDTEKS